MSNFVYGKWEEVKGTELRTQKRTGILKGRYKPFYQCKDYFEIWVWGEGFESPGFSTVKESENWILENIHLLM